MLIGCTSKGTITVSEIDLMTTKDPFGILHKTYCGNCDAGNRKPESLMFATLSKSASCAMEIYTLDCDDLHWLVGNTFILKYAWNLDIKSIVFP